MYYITKEDNLLIKYEVKLNKEKLKKIKIKIITESNQYENIKLTMIIDQLLNENLTIIPLLNNSIEEIINKEKLSIENKIKSFHIKILTAVEPELTEILDKIVELNEERKMYLNLEENNKNLKSNIEYYEQIKKCISFNKIDTIDISTLKKINKFFDGITDKNLSHDFDNKILSKIIKY